MYLLFFYSRYLKKKSTPKKVKFSYMKNIQLSKTNPNSYLTKALANNGQVI